MNKPNPNSDNSEAMVYVKSLRDSVKRRYAAEYLSWMRAGRTGSAPSRRNLSPVIGLAVQTNLEALG